MICCPANAVADSEFGWWVIYLVVDAELTALGRHHAEHPLQSAYKCARERRLHDQQSGERGDQWRRIAQTNKLSRHEGRDRRFRQPRTTGQH